MYQPVDKPPFVKSHHNNLTSIDLHCNTCVFASHLSITTICLAVVRSFTLNQYLGIAHGCTIHHTSASERFEYQTETGGCFPQPIVKWIREVLSHMLQFGAPCSLCWPTAIFPPILQSLCTVAASIHHHKKSL